MQLARSGTANRGEKLLTTNRLHIAELLGFITEVEGQIDEIL